MTIRPEIKLQWLGTVDQGKQLELGADIEGVYWQLATLVADDKDESLWFEVYIGDKAVQIPLDVVQEALKSAPGEVHSETWYEQNVYSKLDKD